MNRQQSYKLQVTSYKKEAGQAFLVLLLILVVTLTVGLSVVARTISNVKESGTTERSTRAFSAAEAALESTLRQDPASLLPSGQPSATVPPINIGGAQATITITKTGAQLGAYQPVRPVSQDEAIQLNLDMTDVPVANRADSLVIYWTKKNAPDEPQTCAANSPAVAALEVTIIGATPIPNPTNFPVTRYAYNASNCSAGYGAGTNFSSSVDGTDFMSKTSPAITIPANAKIMRLRPLFGDATIRVVPVKSSIEPNGQIPIQSYKIRSEGVSGDTKRVVEVERSVGGLPAIFDYVLFNGSSSVVLQKN